MREVFDLLLPSYNTKEDVDRLIHALLDITSREIRIHILF